MGKSVLLGGSVPPHEGNDDAIDHGPAIIAI